MFLDVAVWPMILFFGIVILIMGALIIGSVFIVIILVKKHNKQKNMVNPTDDNWKGIKNE
jgi:uncharacterized alpha/beta hydrolase family protein